MIFAHPEALQEASPIFQKFREIRKLGKTNWCLKTQEETEIDGTELFL